MRKENSGEKRKEIRWRVQLQSPIFLIRCGKNPVIYDDPAPLTSFQCPSSIQSLNLAHFDSVLGPKKILRINPANLGKNPSCSQKSLLSRLDIQTGISWAFDIEIKRFKSPNLSTCPGLQLWCRIQSEINSFSITELQPNSAGNLFAARFYVFTLDFKQEYLEFLISKSSNSKFKFIYVSWTTNLMKELKWDKIILENKICQ